MNAASTLTLQDYWGIAVRRKWLILGAILLSLGVAAALCKVLPKSYRSSTLILVERQKIPEKFVEGIIEGSIEQRLSLIKQQVMSQALLGEVIREFNLYKKQVKEHGLDAAVGKVRAGVKVQTIGSKARRGRTVDSFTISFSHENPVTAMKVTSRLASKFIEENLKHREQFVQGASRFLEMELARAKAELEKMEQRISAFKSRHMGELPQQMEANLRALDRLQNELIALDGSIQHMSERLVTIEKAISEYDATGETTPEVASVQAEPSQPHRRLRELEHKLLVLSAEYKDVYPDIITTKQEIENIKAQLKEDYGEETNELGAIHVDPYLSELVKQQDMAKSELAVLKRRKGRLAGRKQEFERHVERAPTLEQELLILRRDYENMKANYNTLLDKRLNARIAENLERQQKGEQFRMLDPANLPRTPETPDRMRIMLLGLAGGCALGFGSAFALEMLRRPFRRPEELEQELGLHVLAAVPDFTFVYGRSSRQRSLAALPASVVKVGRFVTRYREDQVGPGKAAQAVPLPARGRTSPESSEMSLITKWQPTSIVAEQYRVIASQLSLLEAGRESSIIVMTSSVKGEGKSTTAANLAYTLARDLGKRTLLVDCDLKCPVAHQYLSIPHEPGLAEVLNQKVPLERCLHQVGEIPFWVLPVGDRGQRTTDLPKAKLLAAAFGELRTQFEYILVDAPPILPLADMNVLTQLADVLVMVVRAGVTQQQVVHRALKTWGPPTQPHVILNRVESTSMPYYMYYDYHARSVEARSL